LSIIILVIITRMISFLSIFKLSSSSHHGHNSFKSVHDATRVAILTNSNKNSYYSSNYSHYSNKNNLFFCIKIPQYICIIFTYQIYQLSFTI